MTLLLVFAPALFIYRRESSTTELSRSPWPDRPAISSSATIFQESDPGNPVSGFLSMTKLPLFFPLRADEDSKVLDNLILPLSFATCREFRQKYFIEIPLETFWYSIVMEIDVRLKKCQRRGAPGWGELPPTRFLFPTCKGGSRLTREVSF